MLAFVRHLGFEIHRLPGEDDVLEARLTLRRGLIARRHQRPMAATHTVTRPSTRFTMMSRRMLSAARAGSVP